MQFGIVTIRCQRRMHRHPSGVRGSMSRACMRRCFGPSQRPRASDARHAICGCCMHAVGLRNRIDIARCRSKVSAMCQQRRSTSSARRYARVDRTDRTRIDVLSAENSRALSHLRIVFFDAHRAARASSRTTMPNAHEPRARVHDAHAHNIACCCKPA